MKLKNLYLLLCILGTVLPLWKLMPFLRAFGFDMHVFVEQLFATSVGAFFGLDVVVSSVVLWVLVLTDGPRLGMKNLWVPIVGNLLVGVSLGLPLFLYMREARLEVIAPRAEAIR